MVPSERKVTHTVLLFVFSVGGATFPQNLQGWLRNQEQALPAASSVSGGVLAPPTDRLVLCQRVVIL